MTPRSINGPGRVLPDSTIGAEDVVAGCPNTLRIHIPRHLPNSGKNGCQCLFLPTYLLPR